MNKSTIIHLPPGQLIHQDFLKEALVKFPTVFGFAMQYEKELVCESHAVSWSVDDFNAAFGDASKDEHRVIILGNWPKYAEGDIQPYVLKDANDQPFLSIFMEGDFAPFAGTNGDHTDESNAADEIILPRLDKAWKDAGEDYDNFVKLLSSSTVQKTMMTAAKHRGFFLFLPREGEPVIFGDNEIGSEYSWGQVSNVEGMAYKEQAEAPPVEDKPKGSFLDRMRSKAAPATSPPPAPDVKNVIPSATKTETAIPKAPKEELSHVNLVEVNCPPKLKGGAKNFWLRLFNAKVPGELPSNHQQSKVSVWVHPELVTFAKRDVESTKDMRKLAEEVKDAQKGKVLSLPKKDAPPPVPQTKDTGKSTVREPSSNYVNTSTVLSAQEKEKSCNLLAGFLSNKLSPLDAQKTEAQWPVFSNEVGVNKEELLFLSADQIMKLVEGNKVATAFIIQLKRWVIESSGIKLEDLIGAKGDEPKAVKEEVPPKPAATAPTGGGLSFLRRTAA
jgi:hypothetical protein